jgi:hypothetical protein
MYFVSILLVFVRVLKSFLMLIYCQVNALRLQESNQPAVAM